MAVVYSAGIDSYNQTMDEELAQPLRAADGGDTVPKVFTQGFDCYNQAVTGDVAKPLNNAATDSDHVPCVAIGVPLGFKAESTYLYDDVGTTVCNGTRPGFTCGVIIENHPTDSRVKICENNIVPTLASSMGTGGNNVPLIMKSMAIEAHPKDSRYQIISPETNQCIPSIMCHDAAHGGLIMKNSINESYQNVTGTLDCGIAKMTAQQLATSNMFVANSHVVRRLTPLECERLQGFPDGWTDIGEWIDSKGKKRKEADSPRYKALGNSIALPFWEWLAKRICAEYNHPITMGSLFDGIGGFPLAFERAGAKAVWASEIEEFCIAVTKLRFPEGDELSEQNDKLHSTP